MRFHRNAKLGLAGRYQLVLAIEGGGSIRETASLFNVSVATAHRWWRERVIIDGAVVTDRRTRRDARKRENLAPSSNVVCLDESGRVGEGGHWGIA